MSGSGDPVSGGRYEAKLSATVEGLARVMDPEYAPVWLRKPVPALGDEKPLDVLARGDYRRLSRLIPGLESPTFC